MTKELNIIGRLADRYDQNTGIRSLLQLIPGWSSADTLLEKRADEIRSDRLRTFFDELANGEHELTDELIQTEDFLHCYFCTLRAALNTRQREKIQMLAKLLDSSLSPGVQSTTDEYEELLTVLDGITLREFSALLELYQHELQHPLAAEDNELQNVLHYWKQFRQKQIQELSIPADAFTSFMAKLERTGLYIRITGGYFDYGGDVGRTTPLFSRLLEFVRNEAAQQVNSG